MVNAPETPRASNFSQNNRQGKRGANQLSTSHVTCEVTGRHLAFIRFSYHLKASVYCFQYSQ